MFSSDIGPDDDAKTPLTSLKSTYKYSVSTFYGVLIAIIMSIQIIMSSLVYDFQDESGGEATKGVEAAYNNNKKYSE